VDELLWGFASLRNRRLRADPPRSLHLHATDTGADWLVRIEPDRIDVSREPADADWSVRGSASDLYLLLWNRRGTDGLQVEGDPALLDLWRASVSVRWS
jgi:predicted lipid carrier protein YhbT